MGSGIAELLTAAGVGALAGGVVQGGVMCVRILAKRGSISKALLVEVKTCCVRVAQLEHRLGEHILGDWGTESKDKQYFARAPTPVWDAAVTDAYLLPARRLKRLVAFYSYLVSIDEKLGAFAAAQDRLARVLGRDEQAADSILAAMNQMAKTARRMCEKVAAHKNIKDIDGLPLSYPDTFWPAEDAQIAPEPEAAAPQEETPVEEPAASTESDNTSQGDQS